MEQDEPGRHLTQHFEMLGSRAIYHDGWKAVAFHPVGPLYDDGLKVNAPFDDDVWELYHVAEDHSEVHDLATEYPDKVAELVERWWDEARRNDVLPLDNRVLEAIAHPKPDHRRHRDTFRYFPGGAQVPEPVAVNVRNRSHAITVTIEVPEEWCPTACCSRWALPWGAGPCTSSTGTCATSTTCTARPATCCTPTRALGSGRHTVGFAFEKDEGLGGPARLLYGGEVVAEGVIDRFTPAGFNGVGVGVTCGYEWGPAVGEGYTAPFPFNGTIVRAEVTTTGPVVRDPVLEVAAILAEQ